MPQANWIGHILRRNCLLKQVIEGKIKGEMEVARRRERRRKKLLDDLKDRRGYSHLKEEALHRTIWRHRFEGGFGPVVRQNTEWMMPLTQVMYSSALVNHISGRIEITSVRYTVGFVLLPVEGNKTSCRKVKLLSPKKNTKNATIDHKFVTTNV